MLARRETGDGLFTGPCPNAISKSVTWSASILSFAVSDISWNNEIWKRLQVHSLCCNTLGIMARLLAREKKTVMMLDWRNELSWCVELIYFCITESSPCHWHLQTFSRPCQHTHIHTHTLYTILKKQSNNVIPKTLVFREGKSFQDKEGRTRKTSKVKMGGKRTSLVKQG